MKCVACGAGMRLMQVETDTATVCGIERHIFRCSACPQGAQRLMFNRARMSSIHLPDAAATRPEPPAIKLQAARVAPPSLDKHHSLIAGPIAAVARRRVTVSIAGPTVIVSNIAAPIVISRAVWRPRPSRPRRVIPLAGTAAHARRRPKMLEFMAKSRRWSHGSMRRSTGHVKRRAAVWTVTERRVLLPKRV